MKPIYSLKIDGFTLDMDGITHIFSFFIFIVCTLIMNLLARKSSNLIDDLRKRESYLLLLNNFYFNLNKRSTINIINDLVSSLNNYFNYDFIYAEVSNGDISRYYPTKNSLSKPDLKALEWCLKNKTPCGPSTNEFSLLEWYFEPFIIRDQVYAIIAINIPSKSCLNKLENDKPLFRPIFNQAISILLKKKLEQEEKHTAILREQEKLQRALLSSVSHDLKTPLASIIGSISSIISYNDKFSTSDQLEILQIALDESNRLRGYIDNVVQMLKVESGALKVNIQTIDTFDFINGVYEISKERFIDAKIELDIQFDKGHVSHFDENLIEQVLFNVIENAVKFSKDIKEVKLKAAFKNSNLRFEIIDSGIGIDPKDINDIFNIFYRIEKSDHYTKGSGFGLSVCKGIIELHRGKIYAKSSGMNLGTSMVIELPQPF
ncbi:ATP-binding protein [Francisellaceae bacterium]|nr:ATP-binding protein [Francisellaceae bacterium]